MPRLIAGPTVVPAAGDPPKLIKEFVGRVNSSTESVSVAVMESPQGWEEPGQTPAFDEYTVVLEGTLVVESDDGPPLCVAAGQAVHTPAGQWVRYSTPDPGGARYVAVCSPAFSPDTVHRDAGG
jgi:quercetin dioxygenase-like cupin family protein